ncbi:hypothetical protein B0T25DRAFT_549028 [Lasiosphaeria hispida]|uniref:Nucleoside 2-deoxyribosyltransferase n=1 Tax=Lasiosphaeria hispida TaxID=260671 RepID=A0AAJ0MCQ5_9PEZI|nr:hypothetical protein B0T25DRAFT_549028 [Lasiosphaeria hispida]
MASALLKNAQLVLAPARPTLTGKRSAFLAGTTAQGPGPDWRGVLVDALSHLPVTIFNPFRPDWDSSWHLDPSFTPYREQTEWELDMMEHADVIVVYYGPNTDAPIALLEFGLCARQGKAIVACHRDYRKRGNVQIVSQRLGVEVLEEVGDLAAATVKKLESLLKVE